MDLTLICPRFPEDFTPYRIKEYADIMVHTPLSLYLLAALCPEDVHVRIADENREELDLDHPADLVGITVMEPAAPRAREIARMYRERGIKVVMGGFYPTLIPEEAISCCDSIVVGEAESLWGRLLRDFQRGDLQRIYRSDSFIDMAEIPIIRRRVIPCGQRFYHVETSRGCRFRCDYCSVTSFYENRFRTRPIEHVLEQISEIDGNQIMFMDDNIVADTAYAKELFERLVTSRKLWFAQASINIAKSNELLSLAAESGCISLFIGFETLVERGMRGINKGWADPGSYPALIEKVHDAGIMIVGSFIMGLDHDDPGVFERTVHFCIENRIELPEFFILRPHRGTRLGARLIREDRVREADLRSVTTAKAAFDPLGMSREELEAGYRWAWKEVYSKKAMKERLSHLLSRSKSTREIGSSSAEPTVDIEGRHLGKEDIVIGMNLATHYVTQGD